MDNYCQSHPLENIAAPVRRRSSSRLTRTRLPTRTGRILPLRIMLSSVREHIRSALAASLRVKNSSGEPFFRVWRFERIVMRCMGYLRSAAAAVRVARRDAALTTTRANAAAVWRCRHDSSADRLAFRGPPMNFRRLLRHAAALSPSALATSPGRDRCLHRPRSPGERPGDAEAMTRQPFYRQRKLGWPKSNGER
jgi:hypothetical protein